MQTTNACLRRAFKPISCHPYDNSSSSARVLRQRSLSTTTLWCGRVVFGDDDDGVSGMGSVDIDDQMGEIVACHPGESLAQAQTRRRANDDSSSSSSTVRNLGAGSILSPGMIDVHTHVSQLGRDWDSTRNQSLKRTSCQ